MKVKKYRLKSWVRKTLSIILTVVMFMAVLPDMGPVFIRADGAIVYTEAADRPTIDYVNKIWYSNGEKLIIRRSSRESGEAVLQVLAGGYATQFASGEAEGWKFVGGYKDGTYAGDINIEIVGALDDTIEVYGTYGQDIIGNVNIVIEMGNQFYGSDTSAVTVYSQGTQDTVTGNVDITCNTTNSNYGSEAGVIGVCGKTTGDVSIECDNVSVKKIICEESQMKNLLVHVSNNSTVSSFAAKNIAAEDVNVRFSDTDIGNYLGISGKISGNVITRMSGIEFDNKSGGRFCGVSGTVGGDVEFNISSFSYKNSGTSFVSGMNLCQAQVEGNLTVNIKESDFGCCVNIGETAPEVAYTVKGDVDVYISDSGMKGITCWVNDTTNSTLKWSGYRAGIGSETAYIEMAGFTDDCVYITNKGLSTQSELTLYYSENACTDGKTVVTADSSDMIETYNFVVSDGTQTYATKKIGKDIVIVKNEKNKINENIYVDGIYVSQKVTEYEKGDTTNYTIDSKEGYIISDIKIDGESVEIKESYTFDSIRTDKRIDVYFEKITVNGIEILSQPDKLLYTEGDMIDFSGLKVKLLYTDGTYCECVYSDFEIYEISMDYNKNQELSVLEDGNRITITCKGYSVQTEPLMVKAKETNVNITVNQVDFGKSEEGYDSENGENTEYIEISNTGSEEEEVFIELTEGSEYFTIDKNEITLKNGENAKITVKPKTGLPAGNYSAKIKLSTKSGSLGEVTFKFTVMPDVTMPTGSISISGDMWTGILNQITFGKFFNKTQKITLSANDGGSGVESIYYFIADRGYTKGELDSLSDGYWTLYEKAFNIEPDRNCIIYAKITDKAGNKTYISSDGMVFDATLPKIEGIENNGIYTDVSENYVKKFTVLEENLDYVSIDGKKVLPTNGEYTIYPKDGVQEIIAADKAGNITRLNVTVSVKQQVQSSVVSGITEGGIYCESVSFTLKDDRISRVLADDVEIVSQNGIYTVKGSDKTTQITLIDKDGNESYMYIYIYSAHSWQEGNVQKEPTCTETGIVDLICSNCNEHGSADIPALGHDFSQEWTIDVEPTASTEGWRSHHCTRCDGRRDSEKIPAMGTGKLKVSLVTGAGVPEMTLENSAASMEKNVLTQEEIQQMTDGCDVYITVTVNKKDNVSLADQNRINSWIKQQYKSGEAVEYYDISVTKRIGDGEEINVEQTVAKLILKINVKNEEAGGAGAGSSETGGEDNSAAKTYTMIRLDDTHTEELVTSEKDGELRFATDRFNTIVLIYKDKSKQSDNSDGNNHNGDGSGDNGYDDGGSDGDNPGGSDTSTDEHFDNDTSTDTSTDEYSDDDTNLRDDSDTTKSDKTVKTGDTTPIVWLAALMVISTTEIVKSHRKNKVVKK